MWPTDSWISLGILGGVVEIKDDYFLFITLVFIRLVQKISGEWHQTDLYCIHGATSVRKVMKQWKLLAIGSTLKCVFLNKLCDEMEYTQIIFLLHRLLQMFTWERESCELFELLAQLATFHWASHLPERGTGNVLLFILSYFMHILSRNEQSEQYCFITIALKTSSNSSRKIYVYATISVTAFRMK